MLRQRCAIYASIDDLRRHVRDWLLAYNYAKRLKALRFKTRSKPSNKSAPKSHSCSPVSQAMTCWD
jgi:hypothetical protein